MRYFFLLRFFSIFAVNTIKSKQQISRYERNYAAKKITERIFDKAAPDTDKEPENLFYLNT